MKQRMAWCLAESSPIIWTLEYNTWLRPLHGIFLLGQIRSISSFQGVWHWTWSVFFLDSVDIPNHVRRHVGLRLVEFVWRWSPLRVAYRKDLAFWHNLTSAGFWTRRSKPQVPQDFKERTLKIQVPFLFAMRPLAHNLSGFWQNAQ